MRVAIVTNTTNGAGLQRDYELLRRLLEARGHEVEGIHFKQPIAFDADLAIFLEVVVPELLELAPVNWAVPNPEWWFKGWPVQRFDRVLCKTHDATRIFRGLVGDRAAYLGWEANDWYDPDVPRAPKFLHVAGKSRSKNTAAVIGGARRAGVDVTIIAEGHRRVSDAELYELLNSHTFCLLPSAYEGYGHSLHEAMACAMVIITTQAPPMTEIRPAIYVTPLSQRQHHLGPMHLVTDRAVARAIRQALALTPEDRAVMGVQVREAFLADRAAFHLALDRELETLACQTPA